MATDKVILRDTKKAGENFFSGAVEPQPLQYTLVKITEEDTLVKAASGDVPFVLLDTPASGQFGTYALVGIAKAKCGEEVKEGQRVASNNKGELQVWKSTQVVLGIALEKGESGSLIEVALYIGAKA